MARNLNSGLGIDFQAGFQSGLVGNRGADMVHEIGVACPKCRTSDVFANTLRDGQAQTRSPHCSVCGGDGWLFRDPTLIRGLATSIRQQANVLDMGVVQPGDMQFSPDPAATGGGCGDSYRRFSRNDKFIATWDQPLDDGQTFVRGAASMQDNLGLTVSAQMDPSEDRLWYEPANALWCEDENGVSYSTGDFVLGPGRVIRWVGKQPARGIKYVLKYTAYLEWLAWIPPQERVDRDNKDLGPLVFLRKRHVALVNESPFVVDADRVPLASRVGC